MKQTCFAAKTVQM